MYLKTIMRMLIIFKPYILSFINIVYHYVQDKKKNVNLSIINDFAGMVRH